MRMEIVVAALAPMMLIAAPAAAQDRRVASEQIMYRAYAPAEQKLLGTLRTNPDLPEALLNLAAVYSATGRTDEARAAYQRVLAQQDVTMNLANEDVAGSHSIARRGLRRLDTVQFTAR
ncbi:tetratricopeptide repeat protein [Sphingomonas sp. RS6]